MSPILIITYYWPPAGGPGVQRWLKFTKYLPQFGFKPIVLTVHPHQATYPLKDEGLIADIDEQVEVYYTDTTEPFSAYQKTTGRKEVPFSGFANESDKPGPRQKLAKFVRGNFFLPDARKGWNKHAIKKAKDLLKEKGITTIITTGPPHSTHLIGRDLKNNLGVNWIADFRDPWTDIYYYKDLYPTALATKIDKRMERTVLEKADAISTVSEDMRRLLTSKSEAIDLKKVCVLPNGYDEDDFTNWKDPANADAFVISYVGTITSKYKISAFLTAIDAVAEKHPVKLIFAGKQDEIIANKLAKLSNVNVDYAGYVSHSEAIEQLQNSDVLLLGIPDIPDNKGILTGKLFEYLAAQRPIVCIGPVNGDADIILKEANAGLVFDYTDEEGVKGHLFGLIEKKFKKEKPAFNTGFISTFSRKALSQKLAELIQKLQ